MSYRGGKGQTIRKAEERKAWLQRIFRPSQSLPFLHAFNINHGRSVGDHEFTLQQTLKIINYHQ